MTASSKGSPSVRLIYLLACLAAGFVFLSPACSQKREAIDLQPGHPQVWPETNPSRAGGWAIDDPANNYYYGFLMSWPASLAAYGEDPVTGGTRSSPNRPQYHLNLALSKYRKRVRSFTDGWGAGGMFGE